MARKKNAHLPPAGAAFAFPLGDGRFSVCRVLLDISSEQSKEWDGKVILVACSSWIGDELPSADDPGLRPILRLNHHSWNKKLNVLWISDDPPQNLIAIGDIPPTEEEQAILCMSFGNWKSLTQHALIQWRWDNERNALLAEDAIEKKVLAEARLEKQRERERILRQTTLEQLHEHQFFSRWKDYPPPKAIRASREVMANTVKELLQLGPRASKLERITILQRCIETFNALDKEMHFIETVEREDICEEFETIAHACGLGERKNLADKWRDW